MWGIPTKAKGILACASSRAAALVALLAMALHFAMPLVYELGGTESRDLVSTIICSGGEAQHVYLDENGQPVNPAPSDEHDCEACIFSGTSLAAASALETTVAHAVFVPAHADAKPLAGLHLASAEARAPPA